jgi:hypothetical protein
MTTLTLPLPAASGVTTPHKPRPELPEVEDAQSFYLGWRRAIHRLPKLTLPYRQQSAEDSILDALVEVLASELNRLRSLRRGWDGAHASPVTPQALFGATLVLSVLLDTDSELPQFSPLSSGGVHLEWLAGGDEIEIDIDSSGAVNVLAESASGELIAEGPLDPTGRMGRTADVAAFLASLSARVAAR